MPLQPQSSSIIPSLKGFHQDLLLHLLLVNNAAMALLTVLSSCDNNRAAFGSLYCLGIKSKFDIKLTFGDSNVLNGKAIFMAASQSFILYCSSHVRIPLSEIPLSCLRSAGEQSRKHGSHLVILFLSSLPHFLKTSAIFSELSSVSVNGGLMIGPFSYCPSTLPCLIFNKAMPHPSRYFSSFSVAFQSDCIYYFIFLP